MLDKKQKSLIFAEISMISPSKSSTQKGLWVITFFCSSVDMPVKVKSYNLQEISLFLEQVTVYHMLWACNICIILSVYALLTDKPILVGASLITISCDQVYFSFDFFLKKPFTSYCGISISSDISLPVNFISELPNTSPGLKFLLATSSLLLIISGLCLFWVTF